MAKLSELLSGIFLHRVIKANAIKKAKEKLKEEESIDGHFYISLPAKRNWIDLESGMNNQTFMVTVIRIQDYIKNFGGSSIKTVDSTEDTRIYFKMARTSVEPMFKGLQRSFERISVGEVKLRKY